MTFLLSADFFSKLSFQKVKQFGSRSGPAFCLVLSGSKLFAKISSRQQNSLLAGKEFNIFRLVEFSIKCALWWDSPTPLYIQVLRGHNLYTLNFIELLPLEIVLDYVECTHWLNAALCGISTGSTLSAIHLWLSSKKGLMATKKLQTQSYFPLKYRDFPTFLKSGPGAS